VDDDPNLWVVVQLAPGKGELVAHQVVHRVERFRAVVDQPANGAAPLDDQRLVLGHQFPPPSS
jgi:hypothetical protein